MVSDDSVEHDAWNRCHGERVMLLITFRQDLAGMAVRQGGW